MTLPVSAPTSTTSTTSTITPVAPAASDPCVRSTTTPACIGFPARASAAQGLPHGPEAAFIDWLHLLAHAVVCPACALLFDDLPAPSVEAEAMLARLAGQTRYQQMVRRLGGFMAHPLLLHKELETLDQARAEYEQAQVERLRRYLAVTSPQ